MLAFARVYQMKKNTLSRRALLHDVIHLAVLSSATVFVQACQKSELKCDATGGLSADELQLRRSLEYQDASPHGEVKNCSGCAFYVVASKNECGQCTLIKGPINPRGYCNSWAQKS